MAPGLLGALTWVLAVQAGQPAVAGTIRDGESGAPLSGAVVTLTDADRSVVTDADGQYRLEATDAGPQHLSVKRIGYEPRTVHALVPGDDATEAAARSLTIPVLFLMQWDDELIPLPRGSDLFLLPGRRPIGFEPGSAERRWSSFSPRHPEDRRAGASRPGRGDAHAAPLRDQLSHRYATQIPDHATAGATEYS